MEFFIHSFLKVFGYTEDGEAYTAPVYFVVMEYLQSGRRFAHYAEFDSCKKVTTDDGYYAFINRDEEAQAAAERLLSRIKASRDAVKVNDYWSEIDPAYGSRAYQQAEPFIVAREKEDAYV